MTYAERNGLKPYRYEQPMHGVMGVLDRVGDRLVCHMCGRDFERLETHTRMIHGVPAFEYKRMFGLMRSTPLIGPRLLTLAAETARLHHLADQSKPHRFKSNDPRGALGREATRRDPRLERTTKGSLTSQVTSRRRWGSPEGPLDHCPKGHPWDGYKNVGGGHGKLQRRCRQCNRDSVARWRTEHPEEFKEYRRLYRQRHREEINARRREVEARDRALTG